MARCRLTWTLFARLTGSALLALVLISSSAALAQVQINQQFVPQGPSPSEGPTDIVQSADLPNKQGTVSGAVQAILLDPALGANTVFLGSPNGGVWSTNNFGAPNGGTIWTPLTDKQASLSIASLGLDTTDPSGKTLIAGVGITSNGGWGSGGQAGPSGRGGLRTGLLYSNDAGATWSPLGGAALGGQSVIGVAARGSTILAATFEEQAPTTTQVGTSGPAYGLYRSVNGGQTFSLVTNGLPPGPVTALVADPSNPSKFYASVTSPSNPSAAGVYISTNAGQSWTPVFTSTTTVSGGGTNVIGGAVNQLVPKLATGPNGSVAIAIADVGTGQLSGLYLSQNSGASWSGLIAPPVNPDSKQAVVNLAVAIDLKNTSTVYVTGDCCTSDVTLLAYSVSPGQAPVSLTTPNSSAHADSRALVLDANDNLLVGSDGGIYRLTSPLTNNGVWQGFNTSTLQIREPYAVAYGAYANRFVVAAQDTGGAIQSNPNNVQYNAVQGPTGSMPLRPTGRSRTARAAT
jgi:hypothetical protein